MENLKEITLLYFGIFHVIYAFPMKLSLILLRYLCYTTSYLRNALQMDGKLI